MPVVALAPRDAVFEKMLGNIQEAKARGGSVIAITTEGRQSPGRSPRSATRDALDRRSCNHSAAHADGVDHPAAVARVPHRRSPRLRRRSAEESRQERHGRIARVGSSSRASLNPEQQAAVLHTGRPAAHPRRRGLWQDARHRAPHRVPRLGAASRSPTRSSRSPSPTRPPARCASASRRCSDVDCRAMWISTFHALCARLLRREAPHIGLSRDFIIYDSADQQARRQAAGEGVRARRRDLAAAHGARTHQPRQEPDGRARSRSRPRGIPATARLAGCSTATQRR